MINWNAKFNASSSSNENDDIQTIILRGVLIDSTVNSNGWQIEEVDLADIAKQSIGAQLRLDHSADVRRVKGQILEAEIDGPHSDDRGPHDPANPNVHIHFKAEIVSNDPALIIPITRGYVNRVSIGADAKTVYCSNCGKPTRPIKRCGCKAHEILKDIIVREYSIVTTPAYESAVFTPFAAAVNKYLEGDITSEEKIDIDAAEAKAPISVTSEVTNINYFNGSTASVEDSKTIPIPDAFKASVDEVEDEPKTASDEESEDMKKEKLEEVKAESLDRGEDPKDEPKDFVVNVNNDKIEDPGVMKKASEENKMEKDEKVEVSSTDEKIDALTAAISNLVASLTAVKAEAEEEEKVEAEDEKKEEERVEADGGYPLKDHSPDVGSPMNPEGADPAPVQSPGPLPTAPKSVEIPQKTPSMSAGVSAGLIGANIDGTDVESKAMNEIFAFVAKKGGW